MNCLQKSEAAFWLLAKLRAVKKQPHFFGPPCVFFTLLIYRVS